jgi:hypothetical protein
MEDRDMEKRKLNVNDIIASRYGYNGEIQSYTFYRVVKVFGDCERVRLQRLKKYTRYEREADGNIYYDTYHESVPLNIPADEKTILRKVEYYNGVPIVVVSDYDRSYGTWNGKPLEEYNVH